MPKPRITRVTDNVYGDWEAYYLDGMLIHQYHSVDVWEIMQALSDMVAYSAIEASVEETGGLFPDNLEEVIRGGEE